MNSIKLKGLIRNIRPSHKIKDIEYDQADVIVNRPSGKDDILTIKFKKYSNKHQDGDLIELTGNIRSYSRKLPSGKNKVDLYIFTYFDIPEDEYSNHFELDGRICKLEELRTANNGKENIHFILANNLYVEESSQKLNSYLPCIAWGRVAQEINKLSVNTKLNVYGEMHSREYKKQLGNDDFEFRVAHELVVQSFEVIE